MIKRLKAQYTFLRFHFVHRLSRRAIESWQLKRVSDTIEHARRNVPLYATLYTLVPKDRIGSLAELSRFPIIDKYAFLGRPVEEYTDVSALHEGAWSPTSGTSGEPFTVLSNMHRKKSLPYRESALYRPIFWKPWWRFHPLPVVRILTKDEKRPYRTFITVTEFLADPVGQLQRIAASRPDVLETFPSVLQVIVEMVQAHNLPFRVRYVMSCGERMTPSLRSLVSEVLGCEIFSRYGMEEFKVVATECSHHDGMHVHCESLIVEVVDEVGRALPDGKPGRLVVTDLYNRSMPFIRYDTGDYGKITHERCACGLAAPRVWLEGRYTAYLTFGGKRINHLEFDVALDSFMGSVLRYLVVKESEDSVSIQVIPGPAFSEAVRKKIISNVSALTGASVRVRVKCVEHIPHTSRGKSQIVLDMTAVQQNTETVDTEPLFV